MNYRNSKMKYFLSLTIVLLSLLAACGVDDDPFVCREFCDKWRECEPTVSDTGWDACVDLCEKMNYSRSLVDCLNTQSCELGFDAAKLACEYDPATVGGDEDQ